MEKINFDEYIFPACEIKSLKNGTTEWYPTERDWLDTYFTMVNEQHPHTVTENVKTIKLSILDLNTPEVMKRFRSMGSRSSMNYVGLEKIKRLLDNPIHNYVYIADFGELTKEQIDDFRKWLNEKLSISN